MRYGLIIVFLVASVVDSLASTGNLDQRQVPPLYSKNGVIEAIPAFNAALIVTLGDEFDKVLKSPPENRPDFTRVDMLKIGEQAEMHVIFSNPLFENNSANVTFDVSITRPDSTVKNYLGLEGLTGKVPTSTTNSYLAKAFIRLKAENSDPIGEWKIQVTVHDNNRRSSSYSISDSVTFTLMR